MGGVLSAAEMLAELAAKRSFRPSVFVKLLKAVRNTPEKAVDMLSNLERISGSDTRLARNNLIKNYATPSLKDIEQVAAREGVDNPDIIKHLHSAVSIFAGEGGNRPISVNKRIMENIFPQIIDLAHPATPKYTPAESYKAIKELATTPEREVFFGEGVGNLLTNVVQNPKVKRAYVFGSGAGAKPRPGDIDLLFNIPEVRESFVRDLHNYDRAVTANRLHSSNPVTYAHDEYTNTHVFDVNSDDSVYNLLGLARHAFLKSNRNYGPYYKWKRIAGMTGPVAMFGDEEE